MLLGNTNYDLIQIFFETFLGKFFIVGTIWSFSFQALCEIRHLFWDLGYGFEIKTSNITGLLVIIWISCFNNFNFRKKYNFMINATKKWIFLKISSVNISSFNVMVFI